MTKKVKAVKGKKVVESGVVTRKVLAFSGECRSCGSLFWVEGDALVGWEPGKTAVMLTIDRVIRTCPKKCSMWEAPPEGTAVNG